MQRNVHKIKHGPEKIREFWRLHCSGVQFKVIARQIDVPYWTLIEWHQFKIRIKLNVKYAAEFGYYEFIKGNAA